MFDITSYVMGTEKGKGQVVLSGEITVTDKTGNGDIEISINEEGE